MTFSPDRTAYESHVAHTHMQTDARNNLIAHIVTRLNGSGISYTLLNSSEGSSATVSTVNEQDLVFFVSAAPDQLIDSMAPLEPVQIGEVHAGIMMFAFHSRHRILRAYFCYRDLRWRGAQIVKKKDIFASSREEEDIVVASEVYRAFVSWISRMIWQAPTPPDATILIEQVLRADPDTFQDVLQRALGPHMARQIMTLGKTGHLRDATAMEDAVKRALWQRSFRRHPVRTLRGLARHIQFITAQWLRPTGLEIAILGADGVGKSSVCGGLAASPRHKTPYQAIEGNHLYHPILPSFGQIARWVKRQPKPAKGTLHGASAVRVPVPAPVWFLAYGYYTVDMWLSELLWNRRQLSQMKLVFHDRHAEDISIDLKRYRYTGPQRIAHWMVKIAPKPDVVIVLDAPDDVVAQRKPATPRAETERRLGLYRDYARRHPDTHVVHTSQPLESVLNDILQIVSRYSAMRASKRYNLANRDVKELDTHLRNHGLSIVDTTGASPNGDGSNMTAMMPEQWYVAARSGDERVR